MLMRAILVLLMVPMVSAAPVDLYLHVNGFQDMPMTTAAPDDGYAQTVELGLATHSICIENPVTEITSNAHHVWEGYTSSNAVQYDDVDGKPRLMLARGIAMDLQMDAGPVLHWYMAERQAAVIPDVRLDAVLFQDEGPQVGRQELRTSTIYAQGSTDAVTLAGDLTPDNPWVQYADGVYAWTVPMEILEATATEGLRLRITLAIDEPVCQEGIMMLDTLAVHTDADHRPRLGMGVTNPLTLEAIHPQFIGDDLVVHVAANSPFGRQDVGALTATGLPGLTIIQDDEDTCRAHHCEDLLEPRSPTVIWNTTGAEAGTYDLVLTVNNLQGTAEETVRMTIEVGDGVAACMEGTAGRSCITQVHDQSVPAPAILLLVGLLLARRFA